MVTSYLWSYYPELAEELTIFWGVHQAFDSFSMLAPERRPAP